MPLAARQQRRRLLRSRGASMWPLQRRPCYHAPSGKGVRARRRPLRSEGLLLLTGHRCPKARPGAVPARRRACMGRCVGHRLHLPVRPLEEGWGAKHRNTGARLCASAGGVLLPPVARRPEEAAGVLMSRGQRRTQVIQDGWASRCGSSSASVAAAAAAVSRPFPSWNRSILTDIYLCHACSYHEIKDGNGRAGPL